ncbi:MAG: hypothetical protein K940chlam7_01497 [Chlamydiae bacterium]|nr:hypothetical protein [Chlamydiota bacterium]
MFLKISVLEIKQFRDRIKTTFTFLATQQMKMLCCKFLKTNKLTADLCLADEALCHHKCKVYFYTITKYYRMGRENRIMTIYPAYRVYPVIFIFW